jgi:hypothetical protein
MDEAGAADWECNLKLDALDSSVGVGEYPDG